SSLTHMRRRRHPGNSVRVQQGAAVKFARVLLTCDPSTKQRFFADTYEEMSAPWKQSQNDVSRIYHTEQQGAAVKFARVLLTCDPLTKPLFFADTHEETSALWK